MFQQGEQLVKDVDPLLAAGDTSAASRRLAQADSVFANAESLDPSWGKPIVERGWLAYRETDLVAGFDKAYYSKWLGTGLGHSERALKLKPDDPDALELRGTLEYWRWVLNLEPDQNRATKLLADAEKDLRAAVAGNPTAAFAWTTLSWMLMGQSDTAEAELAARRAYEADPYLSSVKQTLWRLFQSSLISRIRSKRLIGVVRDSADSPIITRLHRMPDLAVCSQRLSSGRPQGVAAAAGLREARAAKRARVRSALWPDAGGDGVGAAGLPQTARRRRPKQRGPTQASIPPGTSRFKAATTTMLGDRTAAFRY